MFVEHEGRRSQQDAAIETNAGTLRWYLILDGMVLVDMKLLDDDPLPTSTAESLRILWHAPQHYVNVWTACDDRDVHASAETSCA